MGRKEEKPGDLVIIAEFNNDFNANIALTKLRSAGIPAVLNNETTAAVFGVPLAAYDTIRLLVHRRDADEARGVLSETDTQSH